MAQSNITTSESTVGKQIKLDMGVQMWISHEEWLLRMGELRHTTEVKDGSANLNVTKSLVIEALLACSPGAVNAENSPSTATKF